ncbi:MAG: ribosome assembly RNA-binding protein YhbY [Thermoanaerobaculia bacterium]
MALTGKQRQFLRGLAHALEPVVRIGRAGASPSVIEETKRSLASHELIKVRIDNDDSSERKALAEELAKACDAEVAGTIGKLAILYRRRDEDPEIELPGNRPPAKRA